MAGKTKIRAAAVQFGVVADVAANLQTCLRMIDEAAKHKPDVMVLPEFVNHIAWYRDAAHCYGVAVSLDDDFIHAIGRKAKEHGCYIKINVTLKRDDGKVSGTNVLFDPAGNVVGLTDKQILMGNENNFLEKSTTIAPILETEIGQVDMYACMDGVIPEVARALSVRRPQILLNSLNSFAHDEASLHIPERAAENKVFVVAANKVGSLVPEEMREAVAARLKIDLVGGLAGAEVEDAEGAQGGDVVGAGLEGGLEVEGGAGDVVELLGLDLGEAEVELGEAGLLGGAARRVGARELGVHAVDRREPRAGGHVQADQLFAGAAVGGGELEGLAVEGDGLGDVEDLLLVQEAELDQRGRHGVAVGPLEVVDPPAQQRGKLAVGAELLVELAQQVERADVVGLGLERADEGVRGLGLVLGSWPCWKTVLTHESLVNLERGKAKFYGVWMNDSEMHNIETATLSKSFEISSNVGISKLADKYYNNKDNSDKFTNRLRQIGMMQKSGVELYGEPDPSIKDAFDFKNGWSKTSIPWMSHGYELKMTPLQMLAFYNGVANGGKKMKPYLVQETRSGEDITWRYEPVVLVNKMASGLYAILSALEGKLPPGARLHLFGVKGSCLSEVKMLDWVASADSMAYDFGARIKARQGGLSNTTAHRSSEMSRWMTSARSRMSAQPGDQLRLPLAA